MRSTPTSRASFLSLCPADQRRSTLDKVRREQWKAHREGILAYVATGLSNGRAEGMNGKVRTITRRAFGPWAVDLIALIFLCFSGITVPMPHRLPEISNTS